MTDYSNFTKQSYWCKTGKYQKEYSELWDKLVPMKNKAQTMHGEALRCISKVYYDRYNNGHCNNDVLNHVGIYNFLLYVYEEIETVAGYNLEDLFERLSLKPYLITNEILEHAVNCIVEYAWFIENGETL